MRRFVLAAVLAAVLTTLAGTAAAAAKSESGDGFPPSVKRFNLSGYVLQTSYSLGRNKGNTFNQTYRKSTVQGVPVKGPAVGMTFPPVDYVALQVARKTLYVAWLDPSTHAIVDAFVMNFKTHAVFDYAPGSATPESSGTVKVLTAGKRKIR
jgi:opacity protein-like surface antigen